MNAITRRAIARGAVVAATAGLVGSSLIGCSVTGASSPTGGGGGDSGTINVLMMKQAGYNESDVSAIISSFEADHPKIKVKTTWVPYEALHDKIVTSAPAGTYDVVLMDVIWPAEFASKGLIADVTSKIPADWKTDMLGGALSTAEYDGKYWGAPWAPSTKLFFYNTDMLAKVGATADDVKSWDGVLAVAKKLKDAGVVKYPLSWSWSQAEALICDYADLLGSFGGTFTDSSGKLTLNSPEAVQTLTWMKKTIDDGLSDPASVTYLENDTGKSMAAGNTAMELNWESTFADLNDKSSSTIVGKAAVTAPPAGPSGKNPGVNGSMVWSITSGSKHQDAAWTFLTYYTSQEIQNKYIARQMSDWKSSYTDAAVTAENPEVMKAAGAAYDNLISRPQVENYNAISQILQVQIQNALLGKQSPKDALDEAQKQAEAAK
ncbi:extracellular solute-binding protein [Microbacterium gorillae]|uniref:extracellular solute-binding protein n=1 Tax=Microbacterium gorillae TaxID=1231063 RepID=UPI0006941337|nr:extracellular solute-binding protein [Microbacterium gorillae]